MDSHHLLTTFAVAAAFGVFFMILSAKLRVSAIVVLLIGGILVGPEFLGLVHPESLGSGLNAIISLAVGLILFEGGLTLDVKGYRQVSREILGVLTTGVIVTWVVSTLAIKWVFDFDWAFCVFAASLIIVTGPTVIGPLLRRIRATKKIHHILHWEGVLIDPLGVFLALLCFEWIVSSAGEQGVVFFDFGLRFAVGIGLGLGFGTLLYQILKRNIVPDEYLNIFVLAFAMLNFAAADAIIVESGLLSVTIAGLLVGYKHPPQLNKIIEYKVELKDFLIGLLFVLLAANLKLAKFTEYGAALILVVAVVMLVARPLNIFLSLRGSKLELREKLFLSWVAPRGIVAASMASLFAFQLGDQGHAEAGFLETFTYSVIAGTVIFQGFTAKFVAKALNVIEPSPKGWVIVGAHRLGRMAAAFIQDCGHHAVLIDSNPREVKTALRRGLTAIVDNAMTIDPTQRVEFYGMGSVLAMTPNEDLNRLLCQRWKDLLDKPNLYSWVDDELPEDAETNLAGVSIWTQFAKTTLNEEVRHEVVRRVLDCDDLAAFTQQDQVLLCYYQDTITPTIPEDAEGPGRLLLLETVQEEQRIPTRPEWVFFSGEQNLEALYDHMLSLVEMSYDGLAHQELLTDLVQREEEFTSLIGHGISLPHAHAESLPHSLMVVARLPEGIACKHTEDDINLIILLLSPAEKPVEHLNNLSKVAKLVANEEMRQAILAAEDGPALYQVLLRNG